MHAGGPRLHSGGACRRRLAHQFWPLRGTRQLRRLAAQPGRAACGGGTHAGSPAVLGKPPSAATACACGCNPGCNPIHSSCKPVYPGEPAAADRWAGRRLFDRDGCMAHPAIRCARRCSWFKMAPAFGGHAAALCGLPRPLPPLSPPERSRGRSGDPGSAVQSLLERPQDGFPIANQQAACSSASASPTARPSSWHPFVSGCSRRQRRR